ncbi:MAG: hypothetical protein RI900_2242 [Actinomycetota bacterium]
MTPRGLDVAAGDSVARIRWSTTTDGDFHLEGNPVSLHHRRQAFVPGPWTQLDEVHGIEVRTVSRPGEFDGAVGDAAITRCRGAVLAAWVGDCAPVVLVGDDGAVGVVHAGWRGAVAGVLESAVAAMRSVGAGRLSAYLGPCVHPFCYEFGEADMLPFVQRLGSGVVGRTTWGTPSLDMPAVVGGLLAAVRVPMAELAGCTACSGGTWFSHRRGDRGRQVMAVVLGAGA